jgi:hypothetical protein
MDLLHKYTYTKAQHERFRDLRNLTHHGVGKQQVSVMQGKVLPWLTLLGTTLPKPSG